MFMRVKMSAEEIYRGVYVSVVRTGKLIRATRERMLMVQGNRGSSKISG